MDFRQETTPGSVRNLFTDRRYSMKKPSVGRAIIFSIENFDEPDRKQRRGTQVDADAIKSLFNDIGFVVDEIYVDYNDTEAIQKLEKISQEDFTDYNSFVAVFMSHGEIGTVLMKKGELNIAGHILKNFRGDKCKTLSGKPKIFIFQICRGEKLEEMAKICDGNPFYENFSSPIEESGTDTIGTLQKGESSWVEQIKVEGGVKMNTPAGADFLLCYASAEGYLSFRNEKSGSWYIQGIVSVMRQYMEHLQDSKAEELDFVSLMSIVTEEVGNRVMLYKPTAFQAMQVPCVVSTLTKSLYFPKLTKEHRYEVMGHPSDDITEDSQHATNNEQDLVHNLSKNTGS